ncbi:MAG: TetR/AcrR family transcriptional regulator [Pseudobdellovibrionaceae bacterium]
MQALKKSKTTLKNKKNPTKTDTYHHGDLKKTLIEAAVRMLQKKTPAEISLRELAREAGVSQAAPYRHFKDKDTLLAAISQEGFELKFQYMKQAMDTYKDQPLEMFFQCGLSYFRMGLLHPQHFKLMFSANVKPGPEYPDLAQSAAKSFMLLRDMVKICQQAGVLGPGDPYHKAMHCWCVVNGFAALYADGRLAWLGVDPTNAEQALRTLNSQYLLGAHRDMKASEFDFALFQNEYSMLYKKMMES